MKFEVPFKSGDEYDYMTRFRRWLGIRPGLRKRIKKHYRRRCRVAAKKSLRDDLRIRE